MNKTAFAMSILEMNLDEWEPIFVAKEQFAIKNRKTSKIIGSGKSLKFAILNARNNEIGNLNRKR
jgi:hypothetical protein